MVAVDGGNSFFVNAKGGRYQDMVTQDLVAHVESSYRVVTGRAAAACSASRWAATARSTSRSRSPALVAAVATHSAMLLEQVPSAEQGARRGQMAAFFQVFGDPIDPELWRANDPLARARGARRQGGARALPRLRRRGSLRPRERPPRPAPHPRGRGVPHSFELPPGDHGYEFVRARLEKSLRFLAERLR